MFKSTIWLLFIFAAFDSLAGNEWYWGKGTSIKTSGADGSFEVELDNQKIKDFCKWNRVYFKVSDMGAERTKAALSLALTAFTANKEWGVVVNLPSVEDVCKASSSASQGAGIK